MPDPLAPNVDDCAPEEFVFIVATGRPSTPNGTFYGVPVNYGDYKAKMRLDIAGLETDDFFRRGGPVIWHHEADKILGRVIKVRRYLHPGTEKLEAIIRFHRTKELAWRIRTDLKSGRSWGASIGIESLDRSWNRSERLLVVHRARLIEVSVCVKGADESAMSVGMVVFRTQG